jgi:hypothetical protein
MARAAAHEIISTKLQAHDNLIIVPWVAATAAVARCGGKATK